MAGADACLIYPCERPIEQPTPCLRRNQGDDGFSRHRRRRSLVELIEFVEINGVDIRDAANISRWAV